MLFQSSEPCRRFATALLVIMAPLSSCSSDDNSSGNGPTAGASGQPQGGTPISSGGTFTNAGGVSSGSGGVVGSTGGASTTAGGVGVSCSQSKVMCNMITPSCPAMQVPELNVNGNCYTGGCIPIGSCACQAAADCPDNNQYTCNNSTKRCTPYLI